MNAYDEAYVAGAQQRLGTMLETGVWGCRYELSEFYQLFLGSPIAVRFAAGEPAIVAGRTGSELVREVLSSCGLRAVIGRHWHAPQGGSAEYWTGSVLAYQQWRTGRSFSALHQVIPIEIVYGLYEEYRERSMGDLCVRLDELAAEAQPRTNLQVRRLAAGLSQSQLARAAGVPVRTLQQYEQRQKDINHARADYVLALAHALTCDYVELLEMAE